MASAVMTTLGLSKEVWDAIPSEYKEKIIKAVVEGNISLAKKLLMTVGGINKVAVDIAKTVLRVNPTERFNPIEKACADSFKTGLFGDRHFSIEEYSIISQRRGLVGSEVLSQKDLSVPLRLFVEETKGMNDEKVDALLDAFAEKIGFDANRIKRHFYAIKLKYEDQFLADIEKEAESEEFEESEEKNKKMEEKAEEASP